MAIYLGLGSNLENALGTPREHIAKAIEKLATLGKTRCSSLYKSAPMGPQDQPDFYNAVVELVPDSPNLTPLELLAFVQSLENDAQRVRRRHWGERSLDVDILLFDDVVSSTKTLTLPHYGILERNFVAVPLLELAPDIQVGDVVLKNTPAATDMTGLEMVEVAINPMC